MRSSDGESRIAAFRNVMADKTAIAMRKRDAECSKARIRPELMGRELGREASMWFETADF